MNIEYLEEPCQNGCNQCNQNVHNILYCILKEKPEYYKECYVGYLFDEFNKGGKYPVFEKNKCTQYLQEYVPFHLPQIADSLVKPLEKNNMEKINVKDKCCVLDICSGPATVALGICKVLDSSEYDIKFDITTVEASDGFNDMIKIFKKVNSNKKVNIVENLNCKVESFIKYAARRWKGQFNWIIVANGISSMGKSVEVNEDLDELLTRLLKPNKRTMLTVIETGDESLKACIENMKFSNIRIADTIFESINKSIDATWLKNCKIYRTYDKSPRYRPCINTKSLLLELKNG